MTSTSAAAAPPPSLPFSPASERNGAPILAVLTTLLPASARVLEIASGTGQHAQRFCTARPGWRWQPTDAEPRALGPIAQRCAGLVNVQTPLLLDVLAPDWPVAAAGPFDAAYCANMLHISPWPTCAALMQGVAQRLTPGGLLVVYGPFEVDGEPLAQGNVAFDADLRARDARWGLRRLAAVDEQARGQGLGFKLRHDMPANNLLLVWQKVWQKPG